MANVATYLNFAGTTEAAFEFYKSVFGTEYAGEINRMGDIPASEGMPPVPDEQKDLVMHVALPTIGDHVLMGTDVTEGTGLETLVAGNNVSIMLLPDSKAAADDLFAKLSAGGSDVMAMQDMFWGDYYGSFTDRFGIHWMIDVTSEPS